MTQYRQSWSTAESDHGSLGIQIPHKLRNRRYARNAKNIRNIIFGGIVVILSLVLVATVFAYFYISEEKELDSSNSQDDDSNTDLDFLANVTRIVNSRVLKFGQGSVVHGRDSRYWDKDDRRRDDEYKGDGNDGSTDKDHVKGSSGNKQFSLENTLEKSHGKLRSDHRSGGLYKEARHAELKLYEAEYEASMKNAGKIRQGTSNERDELSDRVDLGLHNKENGSDVDYDDGIDSLDSRVSQNDDTRHDIEDRSVIAKHHENDGGASFNTLEARTNDPDSDDAFTSTSGEGSSQHADNVKTNSNHITVINNRSSKRKSNSRRRGKRRSSCEIKFLSSAAQIVEPLESRKFSRFSLQYTEVEERSSGEENWEPRFAGHQSLQEREESFYARDQKIKCGFIKGPKGSPSTGFDLAEDDARFLSSCHIAVSSCIFGNSDKLRTPTDKVTRLSRKNVCFVMFMDENTLQTLFLEGQEPDQMGFIGLWRIVVVKNLPYSDMRLVGKVPKFLTHRLFPSARYSIWLDSKLRLQSDPILVLEYFLWRKGFEYAISNHYDRHCLWEEVAQNKKLNKFNHTIIDQQFAFYQADGLRRFNASDPNRLLPSNVPEGSFIVRAHTPMSNLFSCLWFNEVDRFTPRDQLSFAYTYLKLRRMNPGKPFQFNMFKDCERRSIAKLFHHRPVEKQKIPLPMMGTAAWLRKSSS